ncbi:uncharacterized protein LOC131027733 [Cryptomeria japonica]|uniref:uncharacterized protein LOC131027733 n=1 Tax=Cryptomeria japonica TaxID=3369 RepID=UPI0027DAB379|nr:uncharacterized protein LOC131027733 [Cryptomeria japonica]
MGAERQGERRARIPNFKSGNGGFPGEGNLSGGGTSNQADLQASQGLLEVKNISDPVTGVVAIFVPDKLVDLTENNKLSASPGKGKRKLEEGEPSKEEATSRKKSKSATGMKDHDENNDIEEIGKEGSEMEIDESESEDSWKDEDVGVEDEEGENESDNDSPIHSASLGNDNSQPMVDLDDKDNEEKDLNS